MHMPIGCMYTWTEHVFRMPSPIWDVIPADITSRVGIDVLSFGGTKNGMMFEKLSSFSTRKSPKRYNISVSN